MSVEISRQIMSNIVNSVIVPASAKVVFVDNTDTGIFNISGISITEDTTNKVFKQTINLNFYLGANNTITKIEFYDASNTLILIINTNTNITAGDVYLTITINYAYNF